MTSQINPNNIDGAYPVPGVPNNTQGFRSNFTETRTNFQFAAQEITALQNSAVLKAALPGTVLDNNMNGGLIKDVKLQDVSYTYLQIAATSGSITIDYAAALFQQINPSDPVSLTFANFPAIGAAGVVQVEFNITNTSQTVTLPAAVSLGTAGIQGLAASVITFGAVGAYQFEFSSVDSGTTITIRDLSRPLLGSSGSAVGYSAGAGGTVAQSGNKSGGVTLDKQSGEITMQNTSLAAAGIVSFVLTNSTVAATDLIVINHVSGGTIGAYTVTGACSSGSATVFVRNNTAGSLSEALVLRYAVIRGAVA